MATTDPQTLSDEIDSLLARYLQLLDEYTSLRIPLSSLQSSVYTNIARANFQAERGVSYGRESYDRRVMQPGRLCRVIGDAEDGTNIDEDMEKITVQTEATGDPDTQDTKNDKEGKDEEPPKVTNQQDNKSNTQNPDPLRMFGFSIPSALRTAQSSSIQLVESSIPRLATVSLQMRALEIQIRRTKKYRAKALALEGTKGSLKGAVGEGVAV
ncbi:hypothetical protein DL95DRAFT_370533 [Leptodontidium sp. 2 PMI_412]|nr:hypothetical protein DL95DRAFT_370533 [Leptodontidium sp. 2 PMI_412]